MFPLFKKSKLGKRAGQSQAIQLHRWSRQTPDLALPMPVEVLRALRITGPCRLSAKRVGQTLILKKKGSPIAWRVRFNGAAV